MPTSAQPEDDTRAERDVTEGWQASPPRVRRVLPVLLVASLGLALIGYTNHAALAGATNVEPLFWVGILAIFAPAAITLLRKDTTRSEAITILVAAGLAIYGVRILYGGGAFWGTLWAKGVDELMHYRTAYDMASTGRLFGANTLLPVSPLYPGLEIIVNAIMGITGLGIVQSGLILVGLTRVLGVLSLYLFLERVATPPRLAGLGGLLYMCAPTFLYQDADFLYESLALALALFCLYMIREAQLAKPPLRNRLNIVAALTVLAVVVTHHMTSFILVFALVMWTLAELGYRRYRWRVDAARNLAIESDDSPADLETNPWKVPEVERGIADAGPASKPERRRFEWVASTQTLPGGGWVPVLGVLAITYWLVVVATPTFAYVYPLLANGVTAVVRLITMQGTGRRLFQSGGGQTSPLLEQAVGISAVLLTLLFMPFGAWYVWKRHGTDVVDRFLAVGALSYPAVLALRLTEAGWYAGSRAVAFVYVPLAFTVAAGIEQIARVDVVPKVLAPRSRTWMILPLLLIMFAGGLIAGNGPLTRLPRPYDPGISQLPTDAESVAAAQWASQTLGPKHRMAADWAQTVLMGSYGEQDVATALQDIPVEAIFVSPEFGDKEKAIVAQGNVEYVLVDRRIAGKYPYKGFIYEPWKSMVSSYNTTILSAATVGKFDRVPEASRVFDSGNIQLYDVGRAVR